MLILTAPRTAAMIRSAEVRRGWGVIIRMETQQQQYTMRLKEKWSAVGGQRQWVMAQKVAESCTYHYIYIH